MRFHLFLSAVLTLVVVSATPVRSGPPGVDMLEDAAGRYPFFYLLKSEGKPTRFIYADWGRFLRVFELKKDRAELVWESPVLGSQVSSLIVKDINGNGVEEIVVSTYKGRIIAWSTDNYELIGENLVEPFKSVTCMAIAQLDNRGGADAVFVAEGFLNIYDVVTTQRIWRSEKPYAATEILLADVDDDEQLEIILNNGYIIDSRFFNEELFHEEGWGRRMSLLDMNGDGYPEILGETETWSMIIYDIYGRREMFRRW